MIYKIYTLKWINLSLILNKKETKRIGSVFFCFIFLKNSAYIEYCAWDKFIKIIVGCTWWRPWFPQRRRVWPTHRGGWAWRQIGPLGKKVFFFCWIWRALILRWQLYRRYRGWRSSWCSWPSWRYQCQGALAWGPCRCRWRRFKLFFFWLSCQL